MKLHQLWIQRYGPLQHELTFHDDLTIIHGPNESGKSLLVEAISKYCMPDAPRNCRVDAEPHGYLAVRDEDDRVHTLGDGTTLPDVLREAYNQDLGRTELENIFIIRNGDLRILEEDAFYSHITDKLTGRRVEDIQRITEALFDAGRLTPGRQEISSNTKYDSAGTHLKSAKALREEVTTYRSQAAEEGIAQLEGEYLSTVAEETALAERLDRLEAANAHAQRQARLDALQADVQTIEASQHALAELPDGETLVALDRDLASLREEQGEVDELTHSRDQHHTHARWAIAAAVIAFVALLALGLSLAGGVGAMAFLGVAVYFWTQARQSSRQLRALGRREEELVSRARMVGLAFEDRADIRPEIADIRQRRERLREDLQRAEAMIERELDLSRGSVDALLEQARQELADLEATIDPDFEAEYDAATERELTQRHEQIRTRRETLESELEQHDTKLSELQRAAYQIDVATFTGTPLTLEIDSLGALDRLLERLDAVIGAIERDADAARIAVDVFTTMQAEEQQEIAELFETGRATDIFQQITADRYRQITYETDENELQVEKSTGERFVPEQLSEGTRDQLFFSIRVGLGEAVLEGSPGFFVMDDAFLTSDVTRLAAQAEIIETLIEAGWQIVYLTSNGDAVDVLSACSSNDPVTLRPLV